MSQLPRCPWCGEPADIEPGQINCGIFRHGNTLDGQPLYPHLSQKECEDLASTGKLLHGCGKPFRTRDGRTLEQCGWI